MTSREHSREAAGPSAEAARGLSAGFQWRFFVRFGLVVALGGGAAAALACLLLASRLGGYAESVTVLAAVRRSVAAAAVVSGLVQVALSGLLLVVVALLASHKVAGPAFRVLRCLREAAKGVMPRRVRFRRGDQVGGLEARFNKLADALVERHRRLEEALGAVRRAEEALRGAQAGGQAQAAARALSEKAQALADLLAKAAGEPSQNHER